MNLFDENLKSLGFYEIYEKLSEKEKKQVDLIKEQMEKSISVFQNSINNKNLKVNKE
jgi:hypothetical protein